jgi:antitoxin component YwqK of YwqJK toxin-antitoxin module
MLTEAYRNGLLEKGEYYQKGSSSPISSVTRGNGIATIFDQSGTFLFEVVYQDGEPVVE